MLILLDRIRNMFDQLVLIVDHQHTIKHIFSIINNNRKVKKLGKNIQLYCTSRKCENNIKKLKIKQYKEMYKISLLRLKLFFLGEGHLKFFHKFLSNSLFLAK